MSQQNLLMHKSFTTYTEQLVHPRHAYCVFCLLRQIAFFLIVVSKIIDRIKNPLSSVIRCQTLEFAHFVSCSVLSCYCLSCHAIAACFLATFYLLSTSGANLQKLPGVWGSIDFCHAPIPRKGVGVSNMTWQGCTLQGAERLRKTYIKLLVLVSDKMEWNGFIPLGLRTIKELESC